MAKQIIKSINSGCAVYRDKEGIIKVGLSEGSLSSNEFFSKEDIEKNTEVITGQYCGAIPSFNPMGTPLSKLGSKISHININPSVIPSDPIIDADLHPPGLIITTIVGYFYINTQEDSSKIPYGLSLGSNPEHSLIVKSVGKVIRITANPKDKINGRLTRWAFEEGTRVHLHRINQDSLYRLFSYFPSFGDVAVSGPLGYHRVNMAVNLFIPFYGFYWNWRARHQDVTGLSCWIGFNANPTGCAYQPNWIKWGKEFYLICEEQKDYQYYAICGVEEPFFSNNSIRVGRIELEMECNIPTVFSSNFTTMCRYFANIIRNCEEYVHVVVSDSSAVLSIAEDYAYNMALNQFMDPIDPNTGKDIYGRLSDAGVTDSVHVGEILCTVNENEVEDEDGVANIAINTKWKTNSSDFTKMIDPAAYKCSFGKSFDYVGKKWYCCGIFRSTEGDESLVDANDIIFPLATKDVRSHYEAVALYWRLNPPEQIFSSYSAFSTIPEELLNISALCYEVFSAPRIPFGAYLLGIPDHHKRSLTATAVDSSGEYGIIGSIIANYAQHENPLFNIAAGGQGQTATSYRRFFEHNYGSYGYTEFYIEYHSVRSILLRLYDIDSLVNRGSTFGNWTISSDFNLSDQPTKILNASGQPSIRTSPLLQENEEEPILTSSLTREGDTELWIGGVYINNASDSSSGVHINPFQTISVMSVFHSNSGYTCVLYTRTKTLANDWVYWEVNQPSGFKNAPPTYGASERYFWLKQSLWCAVVNSGGFVEANFEVKGTLPLRAGEEIEEDYTPYREFYIQPDDIQTTISIQMDGIIKEGSVEIWVDSIGIENKQLIIKEEETETGFSFYVYYGDESKFSSASVSLMTGELIVTFSEPPKKDSKIEFMAEVWSFDSVYAPLNHYSEHVCYSIVQYMYTPLVSKYYYGFASTSTGEGSFDVYPNLKTISYDGVMPINPNVSITEDGKYLIIGMNVAWSKITGLSGRVPFGLSGNSDHPNWYANLTEPKPPTINYAKESLTQIIVLDMNNIVLGEPQLIQKPFLFSQLEGKLTEIMVLN